MKIRLKQRWLYDNGGSAFVAEVIKHRTPSYPCADLRVKQVIKGRLQSKGNKIIDELMMGNYSWSYLEGQDSPAKRA
jgi:hypothetical protein